MVRPMFILNGEEDQIGVDYNCGPFPKIPNYHKRDSWFLLTEGVLDDIVVDERTTVKAIRNGKYRRLVEISRNTLVATHTFNSTCKETSYNFKVTIKANVHVNDPIKFCANVRNISVRDFLNNQFSLDVRGVTRKYSILDYNGIDEDLTRVLTASIVIDDTSGLSYQIATVMTEPIGEAIEILKRRDNIMLKKAISEVAKPIAKSNKEKTYADAIREAAAMGDITDVEATELIDKYNRESADEQLIMWEKLRGRGAISDAEFSALSKKSILPYAKLQLSSGKNENKDSSSVDGLFYEE